MRALGNAYPFLPEATLHRLVRAYGTRASRIINGTRRPEDMGRVFGAGLILSFVAFPESAKQGEVPADVLTMLALTEPAVIMALQICGLLAIIAFPINREVHEANLRKIAMQADESEIASDP